METTTRPFTPDERSQIERTLANTRTAWADAPRFFLLISSLAFLPFVLVALVYRPAKRLFPYFVATALLVSAVYTAKFLVRSNGTRRRDPLAEDLARGSAEVTDYNVVECLEVAEWEDEGVGFFLKTSQGQTLFLQGQYLYDLVEGKAFPCTRFHLARAPLSRTFLGIECAGSYLPPAAKLPAFSAADSKRGQVPEDGEIVDAKFETLKHNAI